MAKPSFAELARWIRDAGWPRDQEAKAWSMAVANGMDPDRPGGIFGLADAPKADGPAQAKHGYTVWSSEGFKPFAADRTGAWIPWMLSAQATFLTVQLGPIVTPGEAAEVVTEQAKATLTPVLNPITSRIDMVLDTIRYAFSEEGRQRLSKYGLGLAFTLAGAILVATRGTGAIVRPVLDKADQAGNAFFVTAQGVAAGRALRGGGRASRAGSPLIPGGGGEGGTFAPGWRRPYRPRHASSDEKPTAELHPEAARASHNLGAYEARARGRAPFRGTAKRQPTKIFKTDEAASERKKRTGRL
jgi:hypothetical protein